MRALRGARAPLELGPLESTKADALDCADAVDCCAVQLESDPTLDLSEVLVIVDPLDATKVRWERRDTVSPPLTRALELFNKVS